MKLVVASPATNTGCAKHCAKNAWLVMTPKATASCKPFKSCRRASSRVGAWLMSLAIIES